MTIYTIGHSTRAIEEFLALLRGHGIRQLVDVRTIPRSRANPHFNQDALPAALAPAGIAYHHLPGLGGLRRTSRDSANGGWRNLSFRGYADHMQTPAFAESLRTCVRLAELGPAALMCAEALPWRCHRSLIADALLVLGLAVREITTPTASRPHLLTPFAQVSGTTITYPAHDEA